jgi:hypothetical protein
MMLVNLIRTAASYRVESAGSRLADASRKIESAEGGRRASKVETAGEQLQRGTTRNGEDRLGAALLRGRRFADARKPWLHDLIHE